MVGVCSYLLVSFWFTRIAANQSSMSAFLTNRVGDCFLTIGMFAILWSFGNIDYSTVFSLAPFVNENLVTIIGICLLIGAMAKSSQVGWDKQIRPIKVNIYHVFFTFYSSMINAGTFSNAWESEGYLNLLSLSLLYTWSIIINLSSSNNLTSYPPCGGMGLGCGAALFYKIKQYFFFALRPSSRQTREQAAWAKVNINQKKYFSWRSLPINRASAGSWACFAINSFPFQSPENKQDNSIPRGYSAAVCCSAWSPACNRSKPSYCYTSRLGIIRRYSTDLTVISSVPLLQINRGLAATNSKISRPPLPPFRGGGEADRPPLPPFRGGGEADRKEADKLKLNGWTEGVVIGLLLSGGKLNFTGLAPQTSLNVRLVVGLPLSEQKYIWFIFFNLFAFCSSYPTYSKTQIYLYTRALPCFKRLYHYFYNSKYEKVMPNHILCDILTPVALAFWLMSSGVFLPSGIVLSTFSHNYIDLIRLINVLIIRYRFSCTIGRINGKPVIFIRAESVKLLADIFSIHPTLILLVKEHYTFKDRLFLLNPFAGEGYQWVLLNTTTTGGQLAPHTERIILNYESLYNRYSTPEKFPRQGNNQQGTKLINLALPRLSKQRLSLASIPPLKSGGDLGGEGMGRVTEDSLRSKEIVLLHYEGKYHQYNRAFIEWFIGFTEGARLSRGGSFVISQGKCVFSIHLHKVDLPLLYEIKSQLNMGNVYSYERSDSVHFQVKDKHSIGILISIFKGKLFLTKRKLQFTKWVNNFSNKYTDFSLADMSGMALSLPLDVNLGEFKPTAHDNWLVGFIEAEGSFMVTITNNKITQRMVLSQKDAELELGYLSSIMGGYTEKDQKGHDRLVVNYSYLGSLIDYLSTRKLYSVKAESFKKWMEIFYIRKNNSVLNDRQLRELKIKAAFINSMRKIK